MGKQIQNGILKVGGNEFKSYIGLFFEAIGESINGFGKKIYSTNQPRMVTNPSAKLVNPFTLLVNFTVDTNQKYQIILQGDYKEKYKESEDGVPSITEDELFNIIADSQNIWFKKE